MCGAHIIQTQPSGHLFHHTDLLPDAIDQVKIGLGKQDGQRNPWKASTGTYLQDPAARLESLYLGNTQ